MRVVTLCRRPIVFCGFCCGVVSVSVCLFLFVVMREVVVKLHHSLVYTLPVVHIISFSPHPLKSSLALAYCQWVIKIPYAGLASRRVLLGGVSPVVAVVVGVALCVLSLFLFCLLFHLGVPFLFLLLLQQLYLPVYGGIANVFRCSCKIL